MPFDPDCLAQRDPRLIAAVLPAVTRFNRAYFRLRCEGLENVPDGAALYVSNHNGGIAGPDLLCTLATLWNARGPAAPLYALAHDFVMRQFTLLGRFAQRVGAIRARPENALRVLAARASALVYPGGDLEAYRHSRHRDRVVFGTRTGFVRVAQRAGVPIVPMVAHGAHRSAYIFHDGEPIARALRLERLRIARFPLAFALPWGLALGPWLPYLPLPFSIRLRVLRPMRFDPADDAAECREAVRAAMQEALDDMARAATP